MIRVDKVLEFSFSAVDCAFFRKTAKILEELLDILDKYDINTISTNGNDYDTTDQVEVVIDMLRGFAECGAEALLPDEEEAKAPEEI